MRPYRGWTKEGKEVRGWYCEVEGLHYIIPDTASTFTAKIMSEHFVLEGLIEVIPKTVGQLTGLKDKHIKHESGQKKVYAGDIFIINENDDDWYAEVGWDSKQARFEFKSFHSPVTDVGLLDAIKWDNCRLIGNIHENGELIEEKDD